MRQNAKLSLLSGVDLSFDTVLVNKKDAISVNN
jgi:hypothetical protein